MNIATNFHCKMPLWFKNIRNNNRYFYGINIIWRNEAPVYNTVLMGNRQK